MFWSLHTWCCDSSWKISCVVMKDKPTFEVTCFSLHSSKTRCFEIWNLIITRLQSTYIKIIKHYPFHFFTICHFSNILKTFNWGWNIFTLPIITLPFPLLSIHYNLFPFLNSHHSTSIPFQHLLYPSMRKWSTVATEEPTVGTQGIVVASWEPTTKEPYASIQQRIHS